MIDVIVIGGGPAGATAAAMAARAGMQVMLLEATTHPRAHVGESLLPGITPILADIDALAQVQRAGFTTKTGSTHLDWGTTPRWDLWFSDSDAYESSWFVERDRFDAILLDAAIRAGVDVRQRAAVRSLHWDGDRIAAVRWTDASGQTHDTAATHVIDASGSAAVVARDRGWIENIEALRHHALWAHFSDAGRLPAPRAGQALFIAEAGRWLWCFPLQGGRASVGVVELEAQPVGGSQRFDAIVASSPRLQDALGSNARRDGPVRRERDWSYRVRPAAGPGYRLVGDAAGFIDPVLSTGVFLAMHSGWDAARSLGGDAWQQYAAGHAQLFDDLLRMVCFYYRQNLAADDYFWESKRILIDRAGPLSPRKAFLVLTSGLIGNLALDDARHRATQQRLHETRDAAVHDAHTPQRFLCVHLRVPFTPVAGQPRPDEGFGDAPAPDRASIYLIVEPDDAATPCMARTPSFSIDAIAPRLGNDPIRHASAEPILRSFIALLRTLDRGADTVGAFWARNRAAIEAWSRSVAPGAEHVRTFGE